MIVEKVNQLQDFLKQKQVHNRIPDWFWAKKIVNNDISFHKLNYDQSTGNIFIKPFNFFLSKNNTNYDFLLKEKNVRFANNLNQDYQSKFGSNDKGELTVNVGGIQVVIKCEQDLEIIKEVFIQGVYNFIFDQPLAVIDIGMNTGWVSLYFATQANVKAVYSFEPFKATYEEAVNNFSLNPELSKKIHPFHYGIGGKDETVKVEYNYELKASIGVDGIPENMKNKSDASLITEEIVLKSASDVMKPIFDQHSDIDFMGKIDCEGSEYAIFESLDSANLLSRFKIIIMEWHEKGPDKLVEYLTKNNFTIFSRRPKSKTIGMIYAVRNN